VSPGPLVSPIVVVGAPGNGETLVADALARAGGLWRPRPGAAPFPDAVEGLDAASRGYDSHRLTADDAQRDGTAEAARASLAEALIDREGRAASEADGAVRPLLWGPRLSLRIPFVDALAPDARFVLVHREPADALADAIAAWRSERRRRDSRPRRDQLTQRCMALTWRNSSIAKRPSSRPWPDCL